MSEELKPCPFCGTTPIGPDTGMVSCEDVGFRHIPTNEWNSAYCWKEIAKWKSLAGELLNYVEMWATFSNGESQGKKLVAKAREAGL